jgi:hypothetical protein
MAFGLLNREQLDMCVADQARLVKQGRALTLPQVVIGRKLISPDSYRQVVERVKAHIAQKQASVTSSAANRPQVALPPEITGTGRYQVSALGIPGHPSTHPSAGRLLPPHMQQQVPGAASQPVMFQPQEPPSKQEIAEAARTWDDAASSVAEASYEVVVEAVPQAPVVTPQAARERKDAGIRSMLGVPEDATEFDFGAYRILGEIASGGMGIIYRARQSDTGAVYALKALINVEQANEKQLRRFIQEAQSAMRLDHPGIVKIHDLGIYENVPYFTMDLIEGKDLHTHLRDKSMQLPELLEALVKTCEAVHYAHEHGVIHRDLKPANIIVRARDKAPILTDFGLAKNLDSTFKLTAEGAMVGTPLFLSPEQVSGKADQVDRRCDVYGLGVMIYQVLTDKLPFVGRNPYEVYRKVLEEDPTPPTQVRPSIPMDLEKICLMCLAKDREERYPTALALAEDIQRHLRGQPVQAKLPTPAAVQKAKAGGAAPATRTGKGASPMKGRAAGKQEQSQALVLVAIGVLVVLIALGLAYIVYALIAG